MPLEKMKSKTQTGHLLVSFDELYFAYLEIIKVRAKYYNLPCFKIWNITLSKDRILKQAINEKLINHRTQPVWP